MQFLYMARRDKYTIDVIASVQSNNKPFYKRNLQLNQIILNNEHKFKLEKIYHPNRMDWELIIEEASSFSELRDILRKRGYKFVPIGYQEQFTAIKKPFA